nr:MAG TPA: hypothetical protein [Caudoviricetes sp.]
MRTFNDGPALRTVYSVCALRRGCSPCPRRAPFETKEGPYAVTGKK